MKCFVCGAEMKDYLQKKMRPEEPEWKYVRCENCGLVLCQTVYEMTDSQLVSLNDEHKSYQGTDENRGVDPHWVERLKCQAKLFADMAIQGVWEPGMCLVDYGCGDGKLSAYVQNEMYVRGEDTCLCELLKYDKYMRPEGPSDYLSDEEMKPGSFDAVFSCSVFEHLLGRPDADEIIGLLKDKGTLCVHTLVCEEVPRDPEWFYLLSGHCTLWTNKSMALLFGQYGFVGCAYHVEARMWFFFKDRHRFEQLKSKAPMIPGEWAFSDKFVDYWKQKPYR